jgi:hypothetical protein
MSTATPPKPGPDREPKSPPDLLGPPEEEFWESYNKRLEFPISTVAAVLYHVIVIAVLVAAGRWLLKDPDRSAVPITLVNLEGFDASGMGSQGSGGEDDPLAIGSNDKLKDQLKDKLPTPDDLPDVSIADLRKILDDNGNTPISKSNAGAYKFLDDKLKQKMLGSQKGAGPGSGKGYDGTSGSGPGGNGADSTRARTLRWVLRFRVSGDDYVAQLAAMGAVIMVPLPPENEKCLFIADLKNPTSRMATDSDWSRLGNLVKFSDTRPESVREVCRILGVKENAKSFWAFFPKGFEEDLTRKEQNYRNRRAEDIEETIFKVITRAGGYEIVVDEQTAKR